MAKKTSNILRLENTSDFSVERIENLTLGELSQGYCDTSDDENGSVVAWGGKLIVRPKFQRAFVVNGNKLWQEELINSVLNKRPINNMYFGCNTDKTEYYNIDGQQRLMTLFEFIHGSISVQIIDNDGKIKKVKFKQLDENWQRIILDYKPQINLCKGTEEDMLKWFKIINQPTFRLEPQELRNAAFIGEWCEDAKRRFSQSKKGKYTTYNGWILDKDNDGIGKYFYGKYSETTQPERQSVLEMALDWASMQVFGLDLDKDTRIEAYMNACKDEKNADDLVARYKAVIDWVLKWFDKDIIASKMTKTTDWGKLYAKYSQTSEINREYLNNKVRELLLDNEVTAKRNIVEYVLLGCPQTKEKLRMLVLREFQMPEREKMYMLCGGIDIIDGKHYDLEKMAAHHIVAWSNGGKTELDNLALISKENHQTYIHNGDITSTQLREARERLINCITNGKEYTPIIVNE